MKSENNILVKRLMKSENNIAVKKNIFYKEIAKNEKQNFLQIINIHKNNEQKKKFDVFAIAAKIARGEHVSSEELKYIKENAPSLYEDAEEKNRERVNREREKDSKSKEGEKTNSANKVVNHSQKDEDNLTKTNDNSNQINTESAGALDNNSASIILNKIILG